MPFFVDAPAPPAAVPLSDRSLADRAWGYLPESVRDSDEGVGLAYDFIYSVLWPAAAIAEEMADPARMVDPARVPFARLPWLAAMAGIDLTAVPDARKREVVADPAWRFRGSVDAIRRRVGVTLTGARQVQVVAPYLGDPWRIFVRTFAAETPDEAATVAAIAAEVPAWLRVTYEKAAGGKSYNALGAAYPTYDVMAATGKDYSTLAQEA